MNINKLIKGCDQAILFSFYPLIYFLPISTALVETFSGIILIVFLARQGVWLYLKNKNPYPSISSRQRFLLNVIDFFRPDPHPLNRAISIFVLINFLSFVFSPYPLLSLKGFIFKLLQGVYLYFAFLAVMTTHKRVRWFIFVFLVSICLVSINGVVEHFTGREFIFGSLVGHDGRISSSFKQANDFGSYLLVAVFLIIGFFMEYYLQFIKNGGEMDFPFGKAKLSLLVIGALLGLTLFCLGFTFSRGAWMGFYLGLFILMYLYRKVFYIPLLIGLLFAGIFFPAIQANRNVSFSSDDVKKKNQMEHAVPSPEEQAKIDSSPAPTNGDKPNALENFGGMGRYRFWQEALHIIEEFPILGVGFNTYSVIAPEYKLSWGGYPHNCYLQMAAETGAIGVLSFLWMLFCLFRLSIRSFWTQTDKFARSVLSGLMCGLIGFLLHSLVDTNFYSVQLGVLMWVAMACLMVFTCDSKVFAAAPAVLYSSSSVSFDLAFFKFVENLWVAFFRGSTLAKTKIILFVVFIIAGLSYINHSNADQKYAKVYCSLGEESLKKDRLDRATKYFQRAIELNPLLAKGYYGLGQTYARSNQNEKAIKLFEKTIEIDPAYHQAYNGLGLIYQEQGEYDKAMSQFSEAVHLPENYNYLPKYRYNIGVTYLKMGHRAQALEEVERIINIDDPVTAQKLKEYIEAN